MLSLCSETPQSACKRTSEIVLVDPRGSMDLALELAFVLASKTLLSADFSPVLLPLRFDCIFEKYMRLAGVVLDEPELSFQTSSWSLRQFAKAMENKGFLVLNTAGETAGLVVSEICHSNIDDMYPDGSVFGVVGVEDVESAALEGADSADDPDGTIEEFLCDDSRVVSSGGDAARAKERRLRDMLFLQKLYSSEEARLEQLHRKIEKNTLKTIEKEFRKLNIRCNVECDRGQHRKGAGSRDKYQTLTHADSGARKFYAHHSSKRGGAQLMLEIQRKTKHIADQIQGKAAALEDKASRPHEMARITAGLQQEPYLMEDRPGVSSPKARCEGARSMDPVGRAPDKDVGAAGLHFARSDTEFEKSADLRGKSNKDTKRPATTTTSGGSSGTIAGACLKLPRKHRDLLRMLGFEGCSDLLSLPPFADLRRGYKKASLELHPDKQRSVATSTAGEAGSSNGQLTTMPFQEFQERYRELLATFYDEDKLDFNAGVKMHLPKAKKKSAHLGRSRQ